MQHLIGEEKERTVGGAVLSLFLLVTKRLYGKEWEWSIGQIKTCRKNQHVKIDDMKEMSELFCGKAAVGGNYNSTRDSIQAEIEALRQLQGQFEGATSAYQKWLDAQSGGEEGDMYDAFQTAIERGDELLKSGLVGTNEFRAIADLFSNQDLSTAPIDQLVEAYNNASPIVKSFFTEGEKGANNFIDKMIEMGYATEDAQTGLIDFSNTDTQSIADSLGIDVEAVEAIFKKLNDYGWEIDLGNISATGIDDIISSVDTAKKRLDEINNYNATVTVKVDATGDEQIQETARLLASLPEETQIKIGIEETGNVDSIINQLATKPDSIQVPVELSDDTKTVTVNEELGETVDEVPPAEGTANFELGFSPLKLPDAFGTANFRLGDYPKSLPTITQTILMKKVGESSGTMLSPAHADGNVALKHDEVALSNEQGQESIVRDGVWRLLPPGTHVEHFKKNDIIFNAAQTKQLLKNGKLNGYGRTIGGAYAEGTYNGMPARASLYASGKRPGSYSSSTSSSSSSSTTSTTSNTDAVNANTKATKKNTDSKKKEGTIFDWVKERLEYFANKTKEIADSITDYVSSAFKERQLSKQISSVDDQITANKKAYDRYMQEANSVNLSSEWKKKVQEGEYDIQSIKDEKLVEKIQKYQEYYDKAMDCKSAVTELRNEQLKLFEDLMNMPTEAAEKKIEKLERKLKNLDAAYSSISGGGSTMSAYADQISKDYNNSLYTATIRYESANQSVGNAQSLRTEKAQTLSEAKADLKESQSETKALAKVLNSAAKKKKNKVSKSNKKKIAKAIKNGTTVSTKGLKGAALKAAKEYNAAVKAEQTAQKEYNTAMSAYNNANANYQSALEEANIAKINKETVTNSLDKSQKTALQYANDVTYKGQNAMLDTKLEIANDTNKARQEALNKANANLIQTQREAENAQRAMNNSITAKNQAIANLNSNKNSLLKNKNVTKYLNSSQLKALKAGQTVDTKGIKNKTALKQIQAYNALVKNVTNTTNAATTATENATTAQQKLAIAQNAQEEAYVNAAEAQAEYAQMVIENEKEKFENIQNYYESIQDYQKSLTDSYATDRKLKEAQGKDTVAEDFQKEISAIQNQKKTLENERNALVTQLNSSVSKGIIKENSEEWYKMKSQIVSLGDEIDNLDMSVMELQDTMREEVFYRALNNALEKVSDGTLWEVQTALCFR